MSYEPPNPDDNLVLRQVQSMRREMLDLMENQVLTAQSDILRVVLHLDETAAGPEHAAPTV